MVSGGNPKASGTNRIFGTGSDLEMNFASCPEIKMPIAAIPGLSGERGVWATWFGVPPDLENRLEKWT